MTTCSNCEGFVPDGAAACPHCHRPGVLRRAGRGLAKLAAGGVMMVTLMACYGGPMDDCRDNDGDGYLGGSFCAPEDQWDCDDDDPKINPGAYDGELDGVDRNCDGVDGIKPPE